jgi:hypothetical protein
MSPAAPTVTPPPPAPESHEKRTVDADNPWPGLFSYSENDTSYFRGREVQIEELDRMVHRERLTALYSPSGVGKTSLLLAGLFPKLRKQNELPVYIRLAFNADAPPLRLQALSLILSAAAEWRIEAPGSQGDETLWEYFHHRDADFWSERNRLVTPVLVFDQFEEAFSVGKRFPGTAAFLDELADLVEGRPSNEVKAFLDSQPEEARRFDFLTHRYRVVLAFREDFFSEIESLRGRMPSIAHNRMGLGPFDEETAFKVVNQTGGRLIEESAARQLVRLAAGAREASDGDGRLGRLQI